MYNQKGEVLRCWSALIQLAEKKTKVIFPPNVVRSSHFTTALSCKIVVAIYILMVCVSLIPLISIACDLQLLTFFHAKIFARSLIHSSLVFSLCKTYCGSHYQPSLCQEWFFCLGLCNYVETYQIYSNFFHQMLMAFKYHSICSSGLTSHVEQDYCY